MIKESVGASPQAESGNADSTTRKSVETAEGYPWRRLIQEFTWDLSNDVSFCEDLQVVQPLMRLDLKECNIENALFRLRFMRIGRTWVDWDHKCIHSIVEFACCPQDINGRPTPWRWIPRIVKCEQYRYFKYFGRSFLIAGTPTSFIEFPKSSERIEIPVSSIDWTRPFVNVDGFERQKEDEPKLQELTNKIEPQSLFRVAGERIQNWFGNCLTSIDCPVKDLNQGVSITGGKA